MSEQESGTDWKDSFSRRDQKWIADRFASMDGLNSFFRHGLTNLIEYGYKYPDLERAYEHATCTAMAHDNLVKIGERHFRTASEKEAAGLVHSAFEFYVRASLCFLKSSWGVLDAQDADKRYRHGRAVAAYEKVIELNPHYEMAKVDVPLPFHDEALPAVFHKAGEDRPTILHLPGMDMAKEQTPNVMGNRFVQRGMNVLTVDGPGQGEARLRGICDDSPETYQKACRAAIDWLVAQPAVDASRIGVYGTSMGSYFGPRVAVEDDRVAALALIKGTWYTKDIIFEQSPPAFKQRYMYMSGITDEDAFDAFASEMTLDGLESQIEVPTFVAHGEYDELMPREYAKQFFDRLDCPKELLLFENQFHAIGGPDETNEIVDWFTRVWDGSVPDDHAEARYVPEYPNHSYIPSPKFDFLSQPDRPEYAGE